MQHLLSTLPLSVVLLLAVAFAFIKCNYEWANAPAIPTLVRAKAGEHSDQATIIWHGGRGASVYRIGWASLNEIKTVHEADRPWLDAFNFTDVANYGQSTHTLDGLLPGTQYAFIIGAANSQ